VGLATAADRGTGSTETPIGSVRRRRVGAGGQQPAPRFGAVPECENDMGGQFTNPVARAPGLDPGEAAGRRVRRRVREPGQGPSRGFATLLAPLGLTGSRMEERTLSVCPRCAQKTGHFICSQHNLGLPDHRP